MPQCLRGLLKHFAQVKEEQLLAPAELVAEFDCLSVSAKDSPLRFAKGLPFSADKNGICHGFCFWFDVAFAASDAGNSKCSVLSTSPSASMTHWKQTVVMIPEMLAASPGARLDCRVKFTPSEENNRHYQIALEMGEEEA